MPITTYPLSGPRFLNPIWFNRICSGRHAATVTQDGTVLLDGEMLTFRDASLPSGTPVEVWLNFAGHFVCATRADIEAESAARATREHEAAEKRRLQLNALRAEAEAFNTRIRLPVRWETGIKDVLSGLSEHSWGDGRNKATVEHIYLLEPLAAGRLKRDEGDFLCTSASGSNGKRWSGQIAERAVDGDGNRYQPKVTCKACLARAAQWITSEG